MTKLKNSNSSCQIYKKKFSTYKTKNTQFRSLENKT